jgi:hypothetical protein
MKNIAIVMAVAAMAALSPIQVQPAQAMSAAQSNALVAQQNYLNSLQGNQGYYGNYGGYNGYANYGGATVNPNGSFSNNGVSWNGADPAGGWRGGGGYRTQIVSPYYSNRVLVVPAYSHRRWR